MVKLKGAVNARKAAEVSKIAEAIREAHKLMPKEDVSNVEVKTDTIIVQLRNGKTLIIPNVVEVHQKTMCIYIMVIDPVTNTRKQQAMFPRVNVASVETIYGADSVSVEIVYKNGATERLDNVVEYYYADGGFYFTRINPASPNGRSKKFYNRVVVRTYESM